MEIYQKIIVFIDKGYSDLCPRNCGWEKCVSDHTGYGSRDYYMIHYVESGKGRLYTQNEEYEIKKGQAFLIKQKENACYVADRSDPWSYVWIGFDGSLASKLDSLSCPVADISGAAASIIKSIEGRTDTREEVAVAAINLIFSELLAGRSSNPHYVRRAVDTINTLYMTPLTVEGIAGSLGLDRRYLGRIFKERTGKSVQEYLIGVRMEQSKRLLRDGISVGDTALRVGYTDSFNFSKMFKKYCSVSPKQYAMMHREIK